jgi:hypothetical protein
VSTLDTRQTNRRAGEEWYTCERCGLDYPRSKMLVQNGLTLCQGPQTVGCVDEPGVDAARKKVVLPLEHDLKPLPQVHEDL